LPGTADLPGSRRLLTIDQGSGLQIIPFNVVLGMVQGEGEHVKATKEGERRG